MKIKKIKNFILKYGEALGGFVSIPAAAFSIIATLMALWIAYDANKTADEAMVLARQNFDSERTTILAVSVNNEDQSITIYPVDTQQTILRAEVIFPLDIQQMNDSTFSFGREAIDFPKKTMRISNYYEGLEFLLDKTQPNIDFRDFFHVRGTSEFPIIIQADIVAKNELQQSAGLYRIKYFEKEGSPILTAILFDEHLSAGLEHEQYMKILSEKWKPRGVNSYKERLDRRNSKESNDYGEWRMPQKQSNESDNPANGIPQ